MKKVNNYLRKMVFTTFNKSVLFKVPLFVDKIGFIIEGQSIAAIMEKKTYLNEKNI